MFTRVPEFVMSIAEPCTPVMAKLVIVHWLPFLEVFPEKGIHGAMAGQAHISIIVGDDGVPDSHCASTDEYSATLQTKVLATFSNGIH